jgi:hypothetical protein
LRDGQFIALAQQVENGGIGRNKIVGHFDGPVGARWQEGPMPSSLNYTGFRIFDNHIYVKDWQLC